MTNEEVAPGLPVGPAGVAGRKLDLVLTLCGSNTCPTIYKSDQGTLVIQGYSVSASHAGVDLPDGEQLVEIPAELLAEAARLMA
jgi:hypothetical protein